MSETLCSRCGQSTAAQSAYDLNGKTYCASCVRQASAEAKAAGQPDAPVAHLSRPVSAGEIRDFTYPQWLKLSFAGLVLLLGVALVNGGKYFAAGRSLYVGERLVQDKKYAEALPYLERTLRTAPSSDKAALLAAKAALLSGHPEVAARALKGHNDGYFDDAGKPAFQEVNDLWNRAIDAAGKLQQAQKLSEQDGRAAEAAALVHSAAAEYPQFPQMALILAAYDGGVAFEKKDYDGFLALSERNWAEHPSSVTASGLASALDCKYAVTGDQRYRQRSEELMAKAREMAQGDKDVLSNLDEYEERHRYRLESREIISKREFDRRFRKAAAKQEQE